MVFVMRERAVTRPERVFAAFASRIGNGFTMRRAKRQARSVGREVSVVPTGDNLLTLEGERGSIAALEGDWHGRRHPLETG
jgi:hypothetical protein